VTEQELAAMAKKIIDSNSYMAIGTADENGQPWVSPVWFATDDHREFVWVSKPGAQHSRNIAARPQVAIVIFDSQVAPGSGEAVYMTAVAEELTGDELERGLGIYARGSEAQGLRVWTREDVISPARHRLFRATASEHFVLSPQDERLPVTLT
jgi:pyridoxine/pyridoxamine 5'-phosphate oxidase